MGKLKIMFYFLKTINSNVSYEFDRGFQVL